MKEGLMPLPGRCEAKNPASTPLYSWMSWPAAPNYSACILLLLSNRFGFNPFPFPFFTSNPFFIMEDLFKKFVNAGVGFISQGNKKVQSTIDMLVKESKISEQEGKKIVDELMKSSETKVKELETQFKGLTDTMMKTVGMSGKAPKATKSGTSKPANSKASGGKSGGASGAAKTANSAAGKAAGTVKKAADSVSKTAATAQHSAAAKAGATRKPAAKKAAPASSDGAAKTGNQND